MPSPLNTPTNERLPNQLWNIKTRDSEMSSLELSRSRLSDSNRIEDMNQKTNKNSNSLIPTLSEEIASNRCLESNSLTKTESDISDSRRISRLGLNLDLSHNSSDNSIEGKARKKPAISFDGNCSEDCSAQLIDVSIPLEKQGWFHGYISRIEAENVLRPMKEGSYLVRRCQSSKQHYSLSLKCVRGFMHIKIVRQSDGKYVFGFSSHMSFNNIPEILSHYCSNRLPIRGAEHMSLLYPVIDQLL